MQQKKKEIEDDLHATQALHEGHCNLKLSQANLQKTW